MSNHPRRAFPFKSVMRGDLHEGPCHPGLLAQELIMSQIVPGLLSTRRYRIPRDIDELIEDAETITARILQNGEEQ